MSYNPFYGFTDAGASAPPHSNVRHRGDPRPDYATDVLPEYDAEEHEAALRDLTADMLEISGDPSGSYPEDYMTEEDAEVCERVVELANYLGWPNANDLGTMEVPRFDLYPTRNSRLHIAKAGLTKLFFFKDRGEAHRGYILGKLGASPDQVVALCDDGLLRSYRSHELDRSNGIGWGRLPDPDILHAALDIGREHGVEHQNVSTNPKSKTLAAKLLENVPGHLLDDHDGAMTYFGLTGYKRLSSQDLIEANPI